VLSGSQGHEDLSRLSFRGRRTALGPLDLDVPAGAHVIVTGPSGAGKSTVVKLLLRFYETGVGRIEVGGYDIRTLTLQSLRDQIGLVPQDPVLFNGTVRENLLFGRPEATDAELENAARAARADDFIAALPEAYETVVGERGVKLSGGQKQRLAIARALLKDPPIVVLDEATSNIDSETEVRIQAALERLVAGRTTLIIAHRLSTLRSVDRLVVMDHGRIVETGRHDDLLQRGGLYAALYDAQFQV